MGTLSKTRCTTPRCIDAISRYGEQYHKVYEASDGTMRCEYCGGKFDFDKGEFQHNCRTCGKSVEPGELVGLFVPHNCKECQQEVCDTERKQGRICRRCNSVFSDCCC